MTLPAHRRHDISDRVWELLEPHLPGRHGSWEGGARDNRLFINAVFWILRTYRCSLAGFTTRYAKNTASFLAAVHIRCIAIWAETL